MALSASIKAVSDPDDQSTIEVEVEYADGKTTLTKHYRYNNVNLTSKDQVLETIQAELDARSGFAAVVEELKAEIDKPIASQVAEAGEVVR